VYRPRATTPFVALLDVHGGNWTSENRLQMQLLDAALASNGVLVAAIDYRLAPAHPYPASVEDVQIGARWLRAEFEGCVGALGSSAGGHLVILCGLLGGNFDFVVADAPITDVATNLRLQGGSHPYWPTQENVHAGSPLEVLERGEAVALPPLLITHGSADTAVPLATSRVFAERYRAAGGFAELREFPGQGHAFILGQPRSREAAEQAHAILAFIRARGK
jgi:acetyl esterase/lipase